MKPSLHLPRIKTKLSLHLPRIKTKPSQHLPRNITTPSQHLPSIKTKPSWHVQSIKTKPSGPLPSIKTKPTWHLWRIKTKQTLLHPRIKTTPYRHLMSVIIKPSLHLREIKTSIKIHSLILCVGNCRYDTLVSDKRRAFGSVWFSLNRHYTSPESIGQEKFYNFRHIVWDILVRNDTPVSDKRPLHFVQFDSDYKDIKRLPGVLTTVWHTSLQ